MLFKAPDYPAVKGFIETSFVDWKGCLASVLFLGGCNFRCPFCHNRDLVLNPGGIEDVPIEYIVATIRKYRAQWIDKMVVTGGEPTIHMNLFGLIGILKREGMMIKLDTNGSNPSVIKGLVNDGLVDCIAMDVKGPLDRYARWCGINVDDRKVRESIDFIMECGIDYYFRMTVVPFLHREEDVYTVADHLQGAKDLIIQTFRPDITLNAAFSRIKPFTPDKMAQIKANVSDIMSGSSIREQEYRPKLGIAGEPEQENLYN
ncbi:MAG: anaerobic ribonucleoside-triphosphate reductase activating protein [Syntrophorhabdaceae bacterium]|nr:anaerobic ribonucleoside-triphosphate reductase activating protein [Syntrophorhabdaceae bacterium]